MSKELSVSFLSFSLHSLTLAEAKVGEVDTTEGGEEGVAGGGFFAVDFGDEGFVFFFQQVALYFEGGGEEAVG